jgi:hypothetical protein
MKRFFATLATVSLVWVTALSSATEPSSSAGTPATPDTAAGDELETLTCGDLFDLFVAASPKEGKDPEKVEEAQDDAYKFVLWVHGYLSGRDGIDFKKRPLNKDGIVQTVDQIVAVCKPDQKKLFLDVVKDIKIG